MGLFHKACDRCRSRKSRCRILDSSAEAACEYCHKHRQRRKNPDEISRAGCSLAVPAPVAQLSTQAGLEESSARQSLESDPHLYIDYVLGSNPSRQLCRPNSSHDQLSLLLGPSPNISFFPAKRVSAISQRLGHTKLEDLLQAIRMVIASKLKSSSSPALSAPDEYFPQHQESAPQHTQQALAKTYIRTYMEHIHPFYPFLNHMQFEKRALSPAIDQDLARDKVWACLYYAVVAVGCQHSDGGSYEARTGTSWTYFERSLVLWRDACLLKGSLSTLQALMSLAIFCQAISGFGMESVILGQAAILAQQLSITKSISAPDTHRAFWVLYYLEKTSCFVSGKVPTLQDSHISCPLPDPSVWSFADYDWFPSLVRYSRLVSKMHGRLLTISSVPQPWASRYTAVNFIQSELESWRRSIPMRFRPGEPLRPRQLLEPHAVAIAVRAHYYYHYAYQTLTWTLLHCDNDDIVASQALELKTDLMQTARSVLELTSYIEISPAAPVWVLALMPLSSLMILFDLVIHNPGHPETSLNLALLDIASGHFSRI
ncbi:fungal-specific transcription factor domain-containing protein [Aspergillus heterothallicus]